MALVHEVRSAARCVFQDLMWVSAWPRRRQTSRKVRGYWGPRVGDDEACRARPRRPRHGLRSAGRGSARGPIEELIEAARLAFLRRGLKARLRAGLEIPDVPAQCVVGSKAQDVMETVAAPVETFGTT